MKSIKFLGLVAIFIKIIIGLFWIDQSQVDAVFEFVGNFSLSTSPWAVYFANGELGAFPYPALMLYVYKLVQWPLAILGHAPDVIKNTFYILPLLVADIGCLWLLDRMFPNKKFKTLYFYFLSPVVIYATFYLGHLDIIALFFMMLSLYYLQKRNYLLMAVSLGLGFSVKLPMMFALPLAVIYLYRNIQRDKYKVIAQYLGTFFAVVLVVSAPFIYQTSYIQMVYLNPQQSLLYDLVLPMGSYKLYIAYLGILAIYARFLMYEKLNKDLFHNFLAVIYSVFVILVPPSENWYVWSFVLCAVLFISLLDKHKIAYALSALFSVVYLITFIATPYIESEPLKNLVFTTFEGILIFVVYVLYKYGIKSNSVYKKKEHATIIGIGGDSGVGKSTLKNSLIDLLGEQNIVPIESDGDHKWGRGDQSWDTITHLNPKANYLYRQAQYLKALKNGASIERVEYDHHTGQLTAPKKVYANDFILVAGLHPFYLPQTRKLIDVKIYLDTQEKLRRHWKIKRDVSLRGYTLDKIMEQINMRELDAEKYIHPQMHYADLVIRFFSDDDYSAGDISVDPKLKLKIMLKLDVEVEGIVEALETYGHEIEHVYDADMKYQHITFKDHVDKDELIAISERYIEHIDELVNGHSIKWVSGYHGVIQLMTLALLSHNMKKGDDYDL
jgi:uridine kinase